MWVLGCLARARGLGVRPHGVLQVVGARPSFAEPFCLRYELTRDREYGNERLLERYFEPATPVTVRRDELVHQFLELRKSMSEEGLENDQNFHVHSMSDCDTPGLECVCERRGIGKSLPWLY